VSGNGPLIRNNREATSSLIENHRGTCRDCRKPRNLSQGGHVVSDLNPELSECEANSRTRNTNSLY